MKKGTVDEKDEENEEKKELEYLLETKNT